MQNTYPFSNTHQQQEEKTNQAATIIPAWFTPGYTKKRLGSPERPACQAAQSRVQIRLLIVEVGNQVVSQTPQGSGKLGAGRLVAIDTAGRGVHGIQVPSDDDMVRLQLINHRAQRRVHPLQARE